MQSLIIAEATKNDYLKQIRKLRKFRPNLPFSEIDLKFIQDYEYYLKNSLKNEKNTRLNSLKFLKQVINKAIKKGVTSENPFKHFSMERIEGNKDHLSKHELEKLEALTNKNDLDTNARNVLHYFLFSCYTGLRFSDIKQLRYKDLEEDVIEGEKYNFIVIDMHKTGKPVEIPILPFPSQFLKESLPNQKIFKVFTNQATNRHLKKLAALAGIKKQITFHSARHTLGSTGLDMGMDMQVIRAILGHTDIRTTQGYTKVSRRSMVRELKKLSNNS